MRKYIRVFISNVTLDYFVYFFKYFFLSLKNFKNYFENFNVKNITDNNTICEAVKPDFSNKG